MGFTLSLVNVSCAVAINKALSLPFVAGTGVSDNQSFSAQLFTAAGITVNSTIGTSAFLQKTVPSSGSASTFPISVGSTFVDENGVATGFVGVGIMVVQNPNNTASNVTLTVKPAASNGVSWGELPSAGIAVKPGAVLLLNDPACAMAVGASGTADGLQVTTSTGTAVPFNLIIGGR